MQATTTKAPRERREENLKFANDGSYASVELLLKKLAHKCYKRVQAMGLGMDIDDVMQEMNLSYVRALRTWNPEGGALFNTYLTTACLNNFNDRVRKPINERRELGMVNMSDMVHKGDRDDDGDYDPLERLDMEDSGQISINSAMFDGFGLEGSTSQTQAHAPMGANPAFIAEHRQNVRSGMGALSQSARAMVVELLRATHAGEDLPRFTELATKNQITPAELRRIKVELSKTFGVKV